MIEKKKQYKNLFLFCYIYIYFIFNIFKLILLYYSKVNYNNKMIKEDYLANLFKDKDKLIKNTTYKYI